MKVAQRAYADHERTLIPCLKCERKFFPDRIEIHQRNCAASKLHCSSTKHSKNSNRDILPKANTFSTTQSHKREMVTKRDEQKLN